jgi:hypothetical protein
MEFGKILDKGTSRGLKSPRKGTLRGPTLEGTVQHQYSFSLLSFSAGWVLINPTDC